MEGVLPRSCNDGVHVNHGRSKQTELDRCSPQHIRNFKSIPKQGSSLTGLIRKIKLDEPVHGRLRVKSYYGL
jgi:hypothetical protein